MLVYAKMAWVRHLRVFHSPCYDEALSLDYEKLGIRLQGLKYFSDVQHITLSGVLFKVEKHATIMNKRL